MFSAVRRLPVFALVLLAAGSVVAGSAGSAGAVTARPASHSAGWHFSKLYRVPHMSGAVNGLACPTTKECVAVSSNEVFWTRNAAGGKKTWHHYALEPSTQDGQVGVILNDVSCPTTKFCVAVDNLGNDFVAANPTAGKKAWIERDIDQIEVLSVSCSSAGTCAGIDYYGHLLSTANPAGSWTQASTTLDTSSGLTGVSCVGASRCAAVSGASKIATTANPGAPAPTWTAKKVTGSWDDVSCPTTHKCVAVGGFNSTHGRVAVSSNLAHGTWKTAKLSHGGPTSIDCASATHCFADNDYSATHLSAKSSAWKYVAVPTHDSQTAVSCPTTTRCYVGTSTDKFSVGKK